MIKVKTRKRKNPILHSIGNINYEIVDLPEYDEAKLISNVSKILERKFKVILNKLPVIKFMHLSHSGGEYDIEKNIIYMDTEIQNDYVKQSDEYVMLHEIGHFVYGHWLSDNAKIYFENYIKANIKTINLEKIYDLYVKYGEDTLKIKFPLIYILIESLQFSKVFNRYKERHGNLESSFNKKFLQYVYSTNHVFDYNDRGKRKVFSKLSTSYTLDVEEYYYMDELFCEIFANYMIYDKKLLHSDNYRVLKEVLPELRG